MSRRHPRPALRRGAPPVLAACAVVVLGVLPGGGVAHAVALGETAASYEVAGLGPATTYSWQVESCHQAASDALNGRNLEPGHPGRTLDLGSVICSSAQSTFTTLAGDPPPAPTGLAAQIGSGTVTLSWTDPGDTGITGYQYQVRETAGKDDAWNPDWTSIAGSGADTTEYTVTGLANGTDYTFEVRPVSAPGAGGAAQTTATPARVPAAPTGLTFTFPHAAKGTIDLSWDDPGDASITGYQVAVGCSRSGRRMRPTASPARSPCTRRSRPTTVRWSAAP